MIALWLNIITFILVVIVNTFSETLPLNGKTTGEISSQQNVLITPAGFTFSIWSLIYLLLAIWVIRQFSRKRRNSAAYRTASPYFVAVNIFNIAWIFVWHYEQFLASVIVMILLLVSLILLYTRIKKVQHTLWDYLPFSFYLGWITVATIVNVAYYLTYIGWNGFGISDEIWTYIMLAVAAGIALAFRYAQRDWFFPLVTIWAFFGIGIKNWDSHASVAYTAFALAAILLISLPLLRKRKTSSFY
ncbi:tryptophan-rich sensory protein [Bacillus testis]|uniref:tryptophan-rich sensory protein n=1 Tax=Bacillus testis TaxID=1622072 RepID=UPI00067EE5A5|nr:tryptophan-rich sensory protein [Bacillus testis]